MYEQHPKAEREEAAAESLASSLRDAGRRCSWRRVEPDPPDFAFEVDGELWAVEETTLPNLVVTTGQQRERLTVERALSRKLNVLCQEIMTEHEQPPGQGYILMPFATGLDLSKPRDYKAFKAWIVDYIESGSRDGASYAGGKALIGYFVPTVISEPGVTPQTIWIRSGMTAPAPELDMSIDQAMSAKREKLARVSGYDQKVLLLTRELTIQFMHHTDEEIAERVRQENGEPGFFDAIFLVDLLEMRDSADGVIRPYGAVRLLSASNHT